MLHETWCCQRRAFHLACTHAISNATLHATLNAILHATLNAILHAIRNAPAHLQGLRCIGKGSCLRMTRSLTRH